MVACATVAGGSSGAAQQVDRYPQSVQFGPGYINTPAAWVSRRSADSWFTLSAKDLPSLRPTANSSLASRLNTNLALDTHWFGRVSIGASLYSQNPEWGAFGQALLIRDGDLGFLPALAVGARNVGRYDHEDRFLIGHDIALDSSGEYDEIVGSRYENFETSPTLYAVMTKDFPLSDYSSGGRTSMSLSVGYGNGIFRDDGGLGDQYNNSGTIARGLFLGSRLVTHPSANTQPNAAGRERWVGLECGRGRGVARRDDRCLRHRARSREAQRRGGRVQRLQLYEVQLLGRLLGQRP